MKSPTIEASMTTKVRVLTAIATAGCVAVAAGAAWAQSYPQLPVKIIVDRPAGVPHDLVARAMADKLSARLRQPVLVDNRTGAGGNLAAEFVARSAPDGYTLLHALDTTLTVNPTLYKNLSFNPLTDLRPLSIVGKNSTMLVVHPSIPVDSVAEFVAYARKNPVTYAHGGNGSPGHLGMEYFRVQADFPAIPVPYRGNAQLVTDLVAGHIKVGFVGAGFLFDHVRAGRLKGLAISAVKRSPLAPDVPTIAEAGYPDFKAEVYHVVLAPADVPEPIAALLESEVQKALKAPDLQERFRPQDITIVASTGAEAKARIEADTKLWAGIVEATGMRVD
jgi:tripartite-type tricarboxylate transporter receptor subunit TctC